MKTLSILLLGAVMLSGCAKPLPLSGAPTNITPTDTENAKGLDVYANLRTNNPDLPKFQGQSSIVVRAYDASDKEKSNVEINARCTLNAENLYTAELSTPAELIVPNYGVKSPVIRANCTHNALSGQGSAAVHSTRDQQIRDASNQGGLLGALIGSVVIAARSREDDDYLYRDLNVNLK